ncbi:unnamed protein product [Symbiodinium pilosum]|uniref:Uncharacterized protein n=1 Tax=Symbiodinium pilosum TaxID=2952 RepID=A0A812M2T0_SYMPI|nr:unnamed protein product [Symbiodinium pilosum]
MNYHGDESRSKILRVIQWSFEALSIGVFPAEDPWHRKFSRHYCPDRLKLANRPLAQGFIGVFDGIQCDWEFAKKLFGLQRFLSNKEPVDLACWDAI